VAGTGGILLNVMIIKMVTDWFTNKETATAMGIIGNSSPAGIALALATVPRIATAGKVQPAGEVGELLVRGPVVTPGYWRQPQVNAASFRKGARCLSCGQHLGAIPSKISSVPWTRLKPQGGRTTP
jgi:acyl-CoA synthetase (AMP-forming)/AMP-acid ligase II